MLDAGVQYPEMVNGRKGIYVCSLKYETIEGYKHVGLDKEGVPYIQGTTMKVVELAVENTVYKWGANVTDELRRRGVDVLTTQEDGLAGVSDPDVEDRIFAALKGELSDRGSAR